MAATPWSIQKDRNKDLDTLPYIPMYGELRKGVLGLCHGRHYVSVYSLGCSTQYAAYGTCLPGSRGSEICSELNPLLTQRVRP